jgi:hypothetical protein
MYPELLRIRVIRDNMGAYNEATEYLRTKPEDGCLHVNLRYIKQETSMLNRNNFRLLASAATIVAQ